MNHLPITPMSPEQQQKLLGQIYRLLEKQVQSYHRHRHLGQNTSIPLELAQELMESMEYTFLQAGGFFLHQNVEATLLAGQKMLHEKLVQAKQLLKLTEATAPDWQTECRWEALRYMSLYLEQYDPIHLAHKGPEDLFYPILIAPPEGIQGIDEGLFYLKILWIENQIMEAFPAESLDALWNRLPTAALNQCEQVLINGTGKALIEADSESLIFSPEEQKKLVSKLASATDDNLQESVKKLWDARKIQDEDCQSYIRAIIPQIKLWTGNRILSSNIDAIFL